MNHQTFYLLVIVNIITFYTIFLSFHFQSSRAFISKHADADRATHRVGQERRPQVYESATETSPSAELCLMRFPAAMFAWQVGCTKTFAAA